MAIFAPALGLVWKSAQNYGLDPRELFEAAGIDPALRNDITARISEDQADELLWQAKQLSNDEAFSFNIAQNITPSFIGPLGLAWLTSASLRKAFERLQRYGHMVSDRWVAELFEHGEDLAFRFKIDNYEFRDPALRERHRAANFVQLCRLAYGPDFKAKLVRFVHEMPSNPAAYYEFFRCELRFGEPLHEIHIPVHVADEPLAGFNPQLVQNMDQMIVDYLARQNREDFVSRTKSEILNALPSGSVSLEGVAAALNVSARTLIRKLKEQDESFKSLLTSIRQELGEKYVMDRSLTLTEISFLLGFSETSSFSRAYRNWTGFSPREHRRII